MATEASEMPWRSPWALVVDDSQIARYILSGQLADLGFEVDVADSAETALARLERGLPDIVFMDHLLPGIDGLEAVRSLRGQVRTATLPIIMYTSQESEGFVDRAQDAGADDVYTKTSDDIRLAAILQKLDLMPGTENGRAAGCGVTAINRSYQPATVPPSGMTNRKTITTSADLEKLLEPSLETHHSKLRKELLAEFAILERHEERMRHDLCSRIDALMRHTTEQLEQALGEDRDARRAQHLGGRMQGFAILALVLACFGLSFAMTWNMNSNLEQSIAEQETALRILEGNTMQQSALREELADAQALVAQPRPAVIEYTATLPPVGAFEPDTESGPGVVALVNELQSMGILGPVRIETTAGSFCVTPTASGYQIEGANVALQDCASLPVRLSLRRP
jgi:CheY-like chemotaxis protein